MTINGMFKTLVKQALGGSFSPVFSGANGTRVTLSELRKQLINAVASASCNGNHELAVKKVRDQVGAVLIANPEVDTSRTAVYVLGDERDAGQLTRSVQALRLVGELIEEAPVYSPDWAAQAVLKAEVVAASAPIDPLDLEGGLKSKGLENSIRNLRGWAEGTGAMRRLESTQRNTSGAVPELELEDVAEAPAIEDDVPGTALAAAAGGGLSEDEAALIEAVAI